MNGLASSVLSYDELLKFESFFLKIAKIHFNIKR